MSINTFFLHPYAWQYALNNIGFIVIGDGDKDINLFHILFRQQIFI
ncbi:MAG: hypothetical protein ACR5K4_03465 [Sodalis sp. (in: enterobacteria)]